jgi:hypothetical protein
MRYVPPKLGTLSELHGVIKQKTVFFYLEATFEKILRNERND